MLRELTKISPIPWKLFDHKPKYFRLKKGCRLLCAAFLGLCCIYLAEVWILSQHAQAVLASAGKLRSVLSVNSDYLYIRDSVEHGLNAELHQVMGIHSASWFPRKTDVEFSDIRVVYPDAKNKPYLVFFLEGVSPHFAEQLAQAGQPVGKKMNDNTDKDHCKVTQADEHGRFSFCLTL